MSGTSRRGNGEGTLTKLPNGSWQAKAWVEEKRVSRCFKTQKEGSAWLKQVSRQNEVGVTVQGMDTPYSKVLDSWLASALPNLRENTQLQYTQLVRDYIRPKLGMYKVGEIKPEHVQGLIDWMRGEKKGVRTIQITRVAMTRSFKFARTMGMIMINPTDGIIVGTPTKGEMHYLDQGQVRLFLAATQGSRYVALFRLAVYTGMRESELLALKWSDVDWATGKIMVVRQLQRKFGEKGKGRYFATPKTKRGVRPVMVLSSSLKVLVDHYENQQEEIKERIAKGLTWEGNDLIFPTNSGKPTNQHNLLRAYRVCLEKAGLERMRFHDLRHTAATIALSSGAKLLDVSKTLGHSKPSVTSDIYAHVLPGYEERVAAIMQEALDSDQCSKSTPITVQKLSIGYAQSTKMDDNPQV